MLSINDEFYTQAEFSNQQASYSKLPHINEHSCIAVCVEDTFTWLTLCLYFKQNHLSTMPIHANIPLATARNMAEKAGCSLLIYRELTNFYELSGNKLLDNSKQNTGIIQMSSGTTGEPKCILRSWADIDIEIKSYCQTFKDANDMTPVIACPITHSYGLICGVMVALARKQTPKIISSINPKYLIKVLKSCHQPLLYSSPVLLQGLLRLWPAGDKLFAAMTSGSTMSAQVFQQISPKVEKLYQQYGCSEAGCISLSQDLQAANDLGQPLPHVAIDCGDGQQQAREIIVKINTTTGIKSIATQDLGYFDSNQNLRFLARLDDTIIVSGLNVYPTEVEDIILQHPKVSDVVIFKIEDAFAGFRICLQYVASEEISPADLRQWCSQQMATFQIPQVLQPVSEIARMANSKVNRKQIAQKYHADISVNSALTA